MEQRSASVVYCSVWIRQPGHGSPSFAGHGSAGGYGYHKESAALEAAMHSAGIKLAKGFGGCGSSAERAAYHAIAKACGLASAPHLIVHH